MSPEKGLRLAIACSIFTVLIVAVASPDCDLVGRLQTGPVEAISNELESDGSLAGSVDDRMDAAAGESFLARSEVADPRIKVVVIAQESNEPLPEAIVMAIDEGGRITESAAADARGELTLRVAASGGVALVAQCRGYLPKRLAAVHPAAQVDVIFRLSRGRALTGSVVDQRGAPIAGARLSIMQLSCDLPESAWTGVITAEAGKSGRFEVQGCSNGSYSVVATHANYLAVEPSVTIIPGREGRVVMHPVAVAVVKWLSSDGASVYPRGSILLDGVSVSLDSSREHSAFLGANGDDPVAAMFRRGEILLRSGEGSKAGVLACRANIEGFEPVAVELRKWSLLDVLSGRAVPDVVLLERAGYSVMVRIEVRYAGEPDVAPLQVLPLGLTSLKSGEYVTESRLGLETPGDAVLCVAPGGYRLTVGYPYQTLGEHDLRVVKEGEGPALFRIDVERGADLVLQPSPILGIGQRVGLSVVGRSAGAFDTGLFAVRAKSPIPWSDMKPGVYRVQCQGAQGRWIGWEFELVRGKRYELRL